MSTNVTESSQGPLQDSPPFYGHPSLQQLVAEQLRISPRHAAFLRRRFASASAEEFKLCDSLSKQILKLANEEIAEFAAGYDFICDIQKREEIFFRRHGRYRLENVQQAVAEVYANKPYMQKYMHGLLLTQVFWSNHTASIGFYLQRFMARLRDNYDLLEIGPGHGLLFSRAASEGRSRSLTGWDLSAASVEATRLALHRLNVEKTYSLEMRDLFNTAGVENRFDAVVFSEVLEHLEQPDEALGAIKTILKPGAWVYINVPINSPAPDHLLLLRSPEEVTSLVERNGLEVIDSDFYPATNYSLDAARRHSLTVSACLIARKPE